MICCSFIYVFYFLFFCRILNKICSYINIIKSKKKCSVFLFFKYNNKGPPVAPNLDIPWGPWWPGPKYTTDHTVYRFVEIVLLSQIVLFYYRGFIYRISLNTNTYRNINLKIIYTYWISNVKSRKFLNIKFCILFILNLLYES